MPFSSLHGLLTIHIASLWADMAAPRLFFLESLFSCGYTHLRMLKSNFLSFVCCKRETNANQRTNYFSRS
jgi:hypothetical protein